MGWYKLGTVSVTNGSFAVTAVGSNFTDNVSEGEAFIGPDNHIYEVASVVSATSLTLTRQYGGATLSGQSYVIIPVRGYIRDLAKRASDILDSYSALPAAAATSAASALTSANLAQDWATKMDGPVSGTDYSAKYYLSQLGTEAQLAKDWATKTASEVVVGQGYGAKKYSQDAATSAAASATSASNASTSATSASTSATSAATSASGASTSASGAATSATSASTSASTAQAWASQMGAPVSGGIYSARYYADQAATSAASAAAVTAGAVIYTGTFDASSNGTPASVETGFMYRITGAGNLAGTLPVIVGDYALKTAGGWEKVSAALANTAVTPGVYGSSTQVSSFTVDSKGRITAAQNIALNSESVGLGNVSNTSDADKPVSTAQQAALNAKEGVWVPTTPAVSWTIAANEFATVSANSLTASLPANPNPMTKACLLVPANTSGLVVSGNGQKIMGLNEDMSVDTYTTFLIIPFLYIDTTYGWVFE